MRHHEATLISLIATIGVSVSACVALDEPGSPSVTPSEETVAAAGSLQKAQEGTIVHRYVLDDVTGKLSGIFSLEITTDGAELSVKGYGADGKLLAVQPISGPTTTARRGDACFKACCPQFLDDLGVIDTFALCVDLCY